MFHCISKLGQKIRESCCYVATSRINEWQCLEVQLISLIDDFSASSSALRDLFLLSEKTTCSYKETIFSLTIGFSFQIPRYKGNIVLVEAKRGEMVATIPWLKSSSTSFTIITGCLWDLLIHITSFTKSGHVQLNLQVKFICSIYTITIIQYQGHHTTTTHSNTSY